MQPFLHLFRFRGRKFQRNRQQQLLGCVCRVAKLFVVILVVNPLMRGMLINQVQPGIILRYEISAVMLADKRELRKWRDLWSRS